MAWWIKRRCGKHFYKMTLHVYKRNNLNGLEIIFCLFIPYIICIKINTGFFFLLFNRYFCVNWMIAIYIQNLQLNIFLEKRNWVTQYMLLAACICIIFFHLQKSDYRPLRRLHFCFIILKMIPENKAVLCSNTHPYRDRT